MACSVAVFWQQDDWQSLCDSCHRVIKQQLEAAYDRGGVRASDLWLDRLMPEHFG